MKSILVNSIDAIDYFKSNLVSSELISNYGYQVPSLQLKVSMPSECPVCNKVLSDNLYPVVSVNNLDNEYREEVECNFETVSIYRCTSCGGLFVIYDTHKCIFNEKEKDGYRDINVFKSQFPIKNITIFSNEIMSLSSEFIKVYNQAELSEQFNLDEISGMGYRRALEFLVDAYVKKKNPTISIPTDMALGEKIKNYIPNLDVKMLAQKTAWIGNDATHIVKKHPNRDITDMKKFIKAIVKFIEFEAAVEDAKTI